MLKVFYRGLNDYNPWGPTAPFNYNKLLIEDKLEEFEDLLAEIYPEGIEDVTINDILWFDFEWVCEMLGLKDEELEEDEEILVC